MGSFKVKINSLSLIEFLFYCWFLSLPFGSFLISYSVGAFTVYPTLIISLIISIYSVGTFRKWNTFIWIYFVYLVIWLLYSVLWLFIIEKTPEVLFDIRSLGMQLLYFLVLINGFYLINRDRLFEILKTGFKIFFYVLFFVGISELFTGNHFSGEFTNKLVDLPISNIFYAPTFLYDNSNDYLLYTLFLLFLNLFFDQEFRANFYHKLLIYTVLLIFSIFAESQFSKIVLIVLIISESALYLYTNKIKIKLLYFVPLLFFLIVCFQKEIFLGPKYKNSATYRINGLKIISRDSNNNFSIAEIKDTFNLFDQQKLVNVLDSLENNNPERSYNVRKNLFLNGLNFIQESPVFGIGPGNYKIRHNLNKVKNYTHTINSAHNFPIEIISQYGLLAWIYFIVLGWFLFKFIQMRIKFKNFQNDWLIVLILFLPIFWSIPSAYLYLDLHWILVPILVISLYGQINKSSTIN